MSAEGCPSWDEPHVTPFERLRRRLAVALQRELSAATGQFIAHSDGYLSAPDVPGVRFKLLAEVDLESPAVVTQLSLFAPADATTKPEDDA